MGEEQPFTIYRSPNAARINERVKTLVTCCVRKICEKSPEATVDSLIGAPRPDESAFRPMRAIRRISHRG